MMKEEIIVRHWNWHNKLIARSMLALCFFVCIPAHVLAETYEFVSALGLSQLRGPWGDSKVARLCAPG